MRSARRARGGQADMFDDPILSVKLVCNGTDPLTNRMVAARGRHECCVCTGPIVQGERIRAESRRSDDGKRILTRRVCAACCAVFHTGDVAAIARRFGADDAGVAILVAAEAARLARIGAAA